MSNFRKISKVLDNQFNAINKRLDELAKTFGRDTQAYNEYESIIRKNFEYRVNKAGNVQIKRGKANANLNRFQRQALDFMTQGGESVGTMREAAKQYLKENNREISKQIIDEMAVKMDYVKAHSKMISKISEQKTEGATVSDSLNDLYFKAAGRSEELTYDELYDLMVKAMPDYNIYIGEI